MGRATPACRMLAWVAAVVVLHLASAQALAQRSVTGGTVDNNSLAAGDALIQALLDVQSPMHPDFGQDIHLVPPGGNPGTWYYTIRPAPIGDDRYDAGTGLPKIFRQVRIIGDPNTAQCDRRTVIIQAQQGQQLRLFFVRPDPSDPLPTSLELQNVVLERGNLADSGGAIFLDEASLTMIDCIARDNTTTTGRGGAIFATRKNELVMLMLTRTNFLNNNAAVTGGAVHAQMESIVRGCSFTNNTAGGPGFTTGEGGAFYSSAFNLTMEPTPTCTGVGNMIPTTFVTNRAAFGGAVYNNAQPQSTTGGDQFRLFDRVEFRNNTATLTGGAVHNFGTTGATAGQLFVRCRFGEIDGNNQAVAGTGNSAGSFGGAIFNNSTSSPFIVNSLFAGNQVANAVYTPSPGEPAGRGGAIASLLSCRPIIRQCEFIDNSALNAGGAVSSQSDACRTTIDDCLFLRNRAGAAGSPGGDGGRGGGVFTGGSSVSFLHNCAFARNTAAQGGAMANDANGSCRVLHCTLSSSQRGGGVHNTGTSTTDSVGREFVNSIIWGNQLAGPGTFASFDGSGGSLSVNYCDLDNPTGGHPAIGGTGNINCDPLHVNPTIGNLHLTSCSPCIDRGSEAMRQSVFAATSAFNTTTLSGGLLPISLQALVPQFVATNDYDDNGTEAGNLAYSDLIDPRPVTPRIQQCEVDMGADESLFFIWANLAITCRERSTVAGTCAAPVFLTDPVNCGYCVGENVVLEPTITGSCPTEFKVAQWRRLSAGSPCPPVSLADPLPGTQVTDGGRFSIDPTTGRLCITGVQSADAGCYYAVLERQSCGNLVNRGPFKAGNDSGLPCVQRIAACACITVSSPPTIATQPPNRNLCEGDPTSITVVAVPPPGRVLCYQWFRRATPCDGSCPTPGSGGTRIQDLPPNIRNGISGECTSTLTFAPLTNAHEGYYYVRVVAWDPATGVCPCPIDNNTVFECAEVTSCCAFIDVVCKPTANATPTTANVCVGGTQSFTATFAQCAGQDLPLVVQWFRRTYTDPNCGGQVASTTAVTGQIVLPADGNDSHTLMIPNAQLSSAGCYFARVHVQGFPSCTVDSPCRCLIVIPPPTITGNPNDRVVCENGTQTISAIVGYSGNQADLCFQWYRRDDPCSGIPTPNDGVPVVNGGGISGATTPALTFNPAVPAHAGYYYLCVRVCTFGGIPINDTKCPIVCSTCARLDVRPPPVACDIMCPGMPDPGTGDCLVCTGANASMQCGDTQDPELCYQWQKQSFPAGPWVDLPGQNGFRLIIDAYNDAQHRGCYRVRVNYAAFAQGGDCPLETDKCDGAISNVVCLVQDPNCCTEDCECKDNSTEPDDRYALWRTGEWDGVNGEPSYEGAIEGSDERRLIKSADDVFLDPYCMHRISVFNGYMMVRAANATLPLNAKLLIYKDCNGEPGELIDELEPDCVQNHGPVLGQPEFRRVQFQFTPECYWLRGGIYWFSLVAIGPQDDPSFEAYWATAGFPGNPSFPTPPNTPDGYLLGKRPVFMDEDGPWQEFDPCCHPCDDFEFCITGESCPIIWDNGKPDFGGADQPNPPAPPIMVPGTRSEKSALTPRNSRAADQFVIKTCDAEEVCYIEGYMLTNCTSFVVHLEIYENDCKVPYFTIPVTIAPYYERTANKIEDLELEGLRVGNTDVRAYRISFCDWPSPLVLQPGRNYWLSLSIQDSFSVNERAFFAHVTPPCDPCTSGNIWKINPGMELAPGRQITEWQSAGADFAFMIATRKQAETSTLPGIEPPACPIDLNLNNTADVEDIFLFLSAFFAGCP